MGCRCDPFFFSLFIVYYSEKGIGMFDLVVLGGGAAGFFGAIAAAERGAQVLLLEV